MKLVLANQATATKRRVIFDLRDPTTGLAPVTTEAGGQPQISTNGGAWTNTGIGTLTHTGFGRYYADLTVGAVGTIGDFIETRYDSAATVETPGDTFRVTAFDPDDIAASVWAAATRSLTTFGTLTTDTATAVWAAGTRTLTSFGTLVADVTTAVWAAGARTLTTFGTLATDTATAVWTAGSRTLTSFGSLVADIVNGVWTAGTRTLTGFGTLVADIWLHATRTLTAFAFNVTVGTNLDKSGYALSAPGVDAIVDALLDESLLTHAVPNSPGAALSAMLATADPWAVPLPGAYAAGSAGNIVGTRLDVPASTRSTLTALQVDTQLSGTHGAGLWTESGGMGTGANTVTITVQDNALAPIVGRMVTVKNALETATIAGPIPTDALGVVVFNLDNGSYKILVASTPSYLPLPAQTLVVSGTTAATFTLTPAGSGTPSAPSLCVVSGFLTYLTGAPAAGVEVIFQMQLHRGAEDGTLLITVGLPVVLVTDASGFFSTELIRTDAMSLHDPDDVAQYNVRIPDGNVNEHITITAASLDLSTVLPGV